MPTYIVLGKFDRQGLEMLLDPQASRDLVQTLADDVGAKLEALWFTTGQYDIVMRLTADSGVSALAFSLSFGGAAGASTETLAAESDVDETLKLARDAHTRHQERGGGGAF